MLAIAPGWELDVDRGPDWLIVRIEKMGRDSSELPPLADHLWSILDQHFTYRLVLEMDRVSLLDSTLIGQLIELYRRIRQRNGTLRLCGLSAYNRRILYTCRLSERLQAFRDRHEAVMGNYRPPQPR